MNSASSLAERLTAITDEIRAAEARAGRTAGAVELVAVSKTQPPEALSEALDAGQTLFGESRIQEARAKIPLVAGRARWHFIGHLQKNKIRHALPLFECFHGIDSLELAQDLQRIAAETGARPRIFLEVNVAGEGTKFGFSPDKLRAHLEDLLALDRLTIDGLMCIPPPQPRAELARKYFAALRELRDRLQTECRVTLPNLSMGMSGDFAVAVEEGATLVRVGTAIFGTRSGKAWKPTAHPEGYDD
jgi:pyridoxal phosphate enzyme (YggS family)